jgi:hypothetical protein
MKQQTVITAAGSLASRDLQSQLQLASSPQIPGEHYQHTTSCRHVGVTQLASRRTSPQSRFSRTQLCQLINILANVPAKAIDRFHDDGNGFSRLELCLDDQALEIQPPNLRYRLYCGYSPSASHRKPSGDWLDLIAGRRHSSGTDALIRKTHDPSRSSLTLRLITYFPFLPRPLPLKRWERSTCTTLAPESAICPSVLQRWSP